MNERSKKVENVSKNYFRTRKLKGAKAPVIALKEVFLIQSASQSVSMRDYYINIKHFHPRLIFAGKARSLLLKEEPLRTKGATKLSLTNSA